MSPGRHAASDGSFGRSAGGAAFRGTLLIAVAVVLGVVLLNANDDPAPFNQAAGGAAQTDDTTTTTAAGGATTATTTVRPPAEVRVLVANGSGVSGAAAKLSEEVGTHGYNVLSPTDTSERVGAAAVYFVEGFQGEAAALATTLSLPAASVQPMPAPPPVADTRDAHVLVVIDAALANRATAG